MEKLINSYNKNLLSTVQAGFPVLLSLSLPRTARICLKASSYVVCVLEGSISQGRGLRESVGLLANGGNVKDSILLESA